MHILDRCHLRLIDYQPHLYLNVVVGLSFDSSGLHTTDTSSIPGMHSRETLSVRQGADKSEIRIAQPPVGGRFGRIQISIDSRWYHCRRGLLGCGIFLSFPQPVVPDSLSGVDFLSPMLPVVSSRISS